MDTTSKLVLAAIVIGVTWGLVLWQRQAMEKLYAFLVEVRAELKKVAWPGRREVLSTTTVVIVAVFIFGIFLSVVDLIFAWVRSELFQLAGI